MHKRSIFSHDTMDGPTRRHPIELIRRASRLEDLNQWREAEVLANEAIRADPLMAEAYMIRARVSRMQGKLEPAMADYTRVSELEPQRTWAWIGRGAVSIQYASRLTDPDQKRRIMEEEVYPSYKTAAKLEPNDGEAGMSLLELEICLGKYREAVSTAGAWWGRLALQRHKVICAWLGAIALIMARKPRRKWSKYLEFLSRKSITLGPSAWCTEEIRQFIASLEADDLCDRSVVEQIRYIHGLFLEHFASAPLL